MWHNFWGGKRKKPCNYYEVISTFHWICMIILLQKVFDVYLRVPAHPILVPIKVTASHFISDGAWPLSRKYNSMRAFANHSFNCPIPYGFKNMDVTWMKARWLIHQYFWSANSTILSASKHKTIGFILEQNKGHFTLKIKGPWSPKSLIGGKCQDCPLHTGAWGPKGPRKFEWVKYLHGMQWIMFHGLPEFASSPPLWGGRNTNQETMTLQNLTTLDLLWFIVLRGPHD